MRPAYTHTLTRARQVIAALCICMSLSAQTTAADRDLFDAYKAEGIDHFMVMPQNEPNSDQPFPSCTWTPEGLIAFLKYLGPEMASRGVDVYLGTMERPDPEMWDKIVTDPEVGSYIKGMGFQWAGKDALPELHQRHPELPCYMTEQECGDGRNDLATGGPHDGNRGAQYR